MSEEMKHHHAADETEDGSQQADRNGERKRLTWMNGILLALCGFLAAIVSTGMMFNWVTRDYATTKDIDSLKANIVEVVLNAAPKNDMNAIDKRVSSLEIKVNAHEAADYESRDHVAYAEKTDSNFQKVWEQINITQNTWNNKMTDLQLLIASLPKKDDLVSPAYVLDLAKRVTELETNAKVKR